MFFFDFACVFTALLFAFFGGFFGLSSSIKILFSTLLSSFILSFFYTAVLSSSAASSIFAYTTSFIILLIAASYSIFLIKPINFQIKIAILDKLLGFGFGIFVGSFVVVSFSSFLHSVYKEKELPNYLKNSIIYYGKPISYSNLNLAHKPSQEEIENKNLSLATKYITSQALVTVSSYLLDRSDKIEIIVKAIDTDVLKSICEKSNGDVRFFLHSVVSTYIKEYPLINEKYVLELSIVEEIKMILEGKYITSVTSVENKYQNTNENTQKTENKNIAQPTTDSSKQNPQNYNTKTINDIIDESEINTYSEAYENTNQKNNDNQNQKDQSKKDQLEQIIENESI